MDINEILEHIAVQLQGTDAFIQIQVNDQYYSRRVGNMNRLTDHPMLVQHEDSTNFTNWMEIQLTKRMIADSTRLNHKACVQLLRQFNSDLSFADITRNQVLAFDSFLKEHHYRKNTIGKIMSIFRLYVRQAVDENLLSADPFTKYRVRSEQTHKESLTEKDLLKIEKNLDRLDAQEQTVAKGFLFAAYTGLRYSDVCRINRNHIKKIGNITWLIVEMQKTGHGVRVPLSAMFGGKALTLIDRRKNLFFPMPSNAMSNIILNKVMVKCNIKKHITMHCARVTCATLCLSKGMPITSIQHILGHKDLKTTARVYAQVTDSVILKDVKKCWKKN